MNLELLRRFLASSLLMLLGFALVGCGGGEEEKGKGATPSAATTASVAGQVSAAAGIELHSIMVFAEGTSYMALTDSEGKFAISGLPVGKYMLRAARPDLLSAQLGAVEVTAADLAKPQPFQTLPSVLLEPLDEELLGAAQFASRTKGSLRGKVSTLFAGDEAGITVEILGTTHRALTLEDGTFELINVEPGSYDVRISRPAYETAELNAAIKAGDVTELPPIRLISSADAADAGVMAKDLSNRIVFGNVDLLMADGTAPSDWSAVRVVMEGTSFAATPDEAGRFEIRDVPPGQYVVGATAAGFLLDQKVRIDLDALAAAEVRLILVEDSLASANSGLLVGRVVFDVPPASGLGGVAVAIAGTNLGAYTDDSGFYSFSNVPTGEVRLVASFSGYKSASTNVRVQGSEPVEVADLLLEQDIKRPEVVFTDPADGARSVRLVQPVQVTLQFNMAMRSQTVLPAIKVLPEVSYRTALKGGSGAGSDVFVLEFDAVPKEGKTALRYGTNYTITVAKSAASVDGVTMEKDFTLRFTTGHAEIIATSPADGDSNYAIRPDSPMKVYFNAPIDPESIDRDDITIRPDFPGGRGNLYFGRDQKTGWTVMYIAGFSDWDVAYTVTIGKGAETITGDRVRNLPYRFSFRSNRRVEYDEHFNRRPPDASAERAAEEARRRR